MFVVILYIKMLKYSLYMSTILLTSLTILISSFGITLLLTPWVKRIALKANIIDKPNERKIHQTPIPRLGGIAIFLGCLLPLLFILPLSKPLMGIFIGSSLIVLLGLMDDITDSPAWVKLLGQCIIALLTIKFGISIQIITNPFGGFIPLGYLSVPLTMIWIVGMINAINLLDGLDGLASGVSAVSALMLLAVAFQTGQVEAALISIALLSSCLAFLKYNFSPAQIFMGDAGSMFLGYMLATISIMGVLKSTATLSILIPFLILGVPISDTLFSIIRRLRNGKAIFKADRGHFHHRLLSLGFKSKQVALICYLLTLILGSVGLVMTYLTGKTAYIVLGVIILFAFIIGYLFKRKTSSVISTLRSFL
jgi:UDP-GlcNAc:undecaprenyl-phosphate/decaprenyl-phosphate GlcNAc-1-phosphate transferase